MSPSVTLTPRTKILLPTRFFRLFLLRRARRSNARRAKGTPITESISASPPLSPTGSTFPSGAAQNDSRTYYDLAQRLQKLTPQNLNWLGPDDVQIIDTAPFASGGFCDVWKGSFQGRPVAIKSLRCYSSSEFNPAEVGMVSLSYSMRPGHH